MKAVTEINTNQSVTAGRGVGSVGGGGGGVRVHASSISSCFRVDSRMNLITGAWGQ